MNLEKISDSQLLLNTKVLVSKEREVLSEILHHLREIDRRKLYCDLRYSSLYEYCVIELKYTQAQAYRRVSAMRLLRDLPQEKVPELMSKIQKGDLSLTNLTNASRVFQSARKSTGRRIKPEVKFEIVRKLESLSSREGERLLENESQSLGLPPGLFTSNLGEEVRIHVSDALQTKLEEVRSLLGIRWSEMTTTELLTEMADLSIKTLREKRFGKKAAAAWDLVGATWEQPSNGTTKTTSF